MIEDALVKEGKIHKKKLGILLDKVPPSAVRAKIKRLKEIPSISAAVMLETIITQKSRKLRFFLEKIVEKKGFCKKVFNVIQFLGI